MYKDKMFKKAYIAQMSYEISDREKLLAEKALHMFDMILKYLRQANDRLDIIYTPFKNNQMTDAASIFEERASLRMYRDEILEIFNEFKKVAFRCVVALQPFDSDTQTIKLKKSFILAVADIEKQVNRFAELFSDLKSNEFSQALVKSVDGIKKEISQLQQIIEDRVKSHIQTNILARNWVDNVSNMLQEKVEKKSPLITELVEEREKMMSNMFKSNK